MKLWLLRHAAVDLSPGLCYGASDVAAHAELTQVAARAAAELLPSHLPVWTSALGRTRALGDALQALRPDLGAPVADARLNEMHFGQWELQRWDAVPQAAFDMWMADFAHHRFGGVESTQAVVSRVASALKALAANGVEEAVWITHAGVIRAAVFLAAHGEAQRVSIEHWPREAPAPGGYIQITL